MDAREKISKARTQLLLDRRYIFWASIGLYLQPVENKQIPTMATDGTNLYYSPDFVNTLTNNELMFVLAHEAGHCALGHHLRRGVRDPQRWNIAVDFALNQMLTEYSRDLKPPKGILLNDKYKDMSGEEIYSKQKVYTMDADGNIFDEKGNNVGRSIGDIMDAKGANDEHKWDVILKQAAATAKAQGYLPGAFEGLLKPIIPKVDLASLLRHLFSTAQREDYTWARVNRKHVHRGMYLPGMYTESMGDIMVGVDVSGSVDDNMAAKFIGIVNVVLSDLKPKRVFLVQCDAQVQKIDEFGPGDCLPERFKVHGRGGTDMRPLWKWAQDKTLTAAVVCSDFQMRAEYFGKPQSFPVVWATTADVSGEAPWGITAKLKEV